MKWVAGIEPSIYAAAHKRVVQMFGTPQRCDQCGTTDPATRYEWANQTGNYVDPDDFKRMCRSCHSRYDNSRRPRPTYRGTRRKTTSRLQNAIQREYGRPWRDVLTHLLYVRRLTHSQTADELRLTRGTVTTWALQIEREATTSQPDAVAV